MPVFSCTQWGIDGAERGKTTSAEPRIAISDIWGFQRLVITRCMIMELIKLTHGYPGTEGGAPAIIQRVRDSSRLGHLHDHALSSISREPGGQVRTPLLTHHRRALSPFSHACTIA